MTVLCPKNQNDIVYTIAILRKLDGSKLVISLSGTLTPCEHLQLRDISQTMKHTPAWELVSRLTHS